jgi:hypothetical protein
LPSDVRTTGEVAADRAVERGAPDVLATALDVELLGPPSGLPRQPPRIANTTPLHRRIGCQRLIEKSGA